MPFQLNDHHIKALEIPFSKGDRFLKMGLKLSAKWG